MKLIDTDFFQNYKATALWGDSLGWHERNGGNFTYWLTPNEVQSVSAELSGNDLWYDVGAAVPELSGEAFLVSGTGKYFHHFKDRPLECAGIIILDETGTRYRIVAGLENNGYPTSELPTHLMNLAAKKRDGQDIRVVYHAHCPNLIAMTFLLPLDSSVFTRELWQMMTECPVIFPEGVGVLPWMVPGGRQIAEATSELMPDYNAVIWAHHGIFCTGQDFDQAIGLMQAIEKSAAIWIKVHSCAAAPQQTITPENMRELSEAFSVALKM